MAHNQLTICAEMVYLDLPIEERIKRIDQMGFGVDIWTHYSHDLNKLKATGVPINSAQGYVHGNLAYADDSEEMLRTAKEILPELKDLGIDKLVIHGAELVDGKAAKWIDRVTPDMWLNAYDTLSRFAELGQENQVTYLLENLNSRVDHPHVPFCHSYETLTLVKRVDSPNLKLMLDLYHAQEDDGHLIETVKEANTYIGELQAADVPGRCEPGTGEVRWEQVAAAVNETDFTGPIGMEGYASGDSDKALQAFGQAFAQCRG
ncbi:MAG: TIM barrel protein [Bifidobacteriales bacterium]|nr:TIM barrel protein [Bifidobacteriales bacterium]